MKNYSKITFFIILSLILVACGSSNQEPTPISVEDALKTAEVDAWLSVTQTIIAGATATPTHTPIPTNTPIPTITSTPLPQPIVLAGAGDSVVDFDWEGPGIIHIKHTGGSNFIVESYDANNNQIDLVVNTIGSYDGIVILNLTDNEDAARFQVTAGGAWEMTISPFSAARNFPVPVTISGIGDEVVILQGNADTIQADNSQGDGNFIIQAVGDRGIDLIFNEISPYTGTALLPSSRTLLLIIKAEGPWSLQITGK